MMGYDWIAGCLDNDSYINEQSDQFFQDIEEFRRLNRDECKTAVKDIDIRLVRVKVSKVNMDIV